MSKRKQRAKIGNKERLTLTIEPHALKMGEAVAKEDKRSLSNLVEVLFQKEHDRVFSKETVHA